MGKILPQYQKSIIDEIISSITSNTSQYYAFAANPIAYDGNTTPVLTSDDYSTSFTNDWQMIFGKKLKPADVAPVISNKPWKANTVYNRYDNTVANLANYYVIVPPSTVGGSYNLYKCIDNANGASSVYPPDQVQIQSFTKTDGYTWRYITSISSSLYNKSATATHAPVTSNTTIVSGAFSYSGVEVVMINNGGVGYSCYTNGTIQSVSNSTLLQLQINASRDNDFYSKNSIYLENSGSATSQLMTVQRYVANLTGNWVYLESPANTDLINATVTTYYISPKVVFETDGDSQPKAVSYLNPSSNSISSIKIINRGSGVSWANVYIQSNTIYGTGANLYAIVPPPGGHGSNPSAELGVNGFVVSFNFSNTESNTILVATQYNKIGLIKNPYYISQSTKNKTTAYSSNTFSSVLKANVDFGSSIFSTGENVIGANSAARGTVAFSNSTVVYLTGDKKFGNERIVSTNNALLSANITINTVGDIFTKDITPLYVQNISNVIRSGNQAESFKLIIKV
jgi:hypothetical protein